MKKVKRFQEGGITINQPAPSLAGLAGYGESSNTYPFQSNAGASASPSQDSGVNQTFNIQPTASTGAPETSAFKKGGKVSSASSRGDGIAMRGKTRGTMVMCGGGMARSKK